MIPWRYPTICSDRTHSLPPLLSVWVTTSILEFYHSLEYLFKTWFFLKLINIKFKYIYMLRFKEIVLEVKLSLFLFYLIISIWMFYLMSNCNMHSPSLMILIVTISNPTLAIPISPFFFVLFYFVLVTISLCPLLPYPPPYLLVEKWSSLGKISLRI